MIWRFIPFKHYEPNLRLALNKVSFESVQNGGDPIISLSGWKPSCVNIGYTQKLNDVLDLNEIEKQNILIVRRESAGGATYLSEEGDICWSIVANENYFPKDLQEIYIFATNKIIKTLNELGIDAWHKPINDVMTEQGKISGTALKKEKKCVYVHGTLLYKIDKNLMNKILKPENDHQKKEKIKEMNKKVTSISNLIDISFEEVVQILTQKLLENLKYEKSDWTKEELEKAKILAKSYSSKEWTNKF